MLSSSRNLKKRSAVNKQRLALLVAWSSGVVGKRDKATAFLLENGGFFVL